MRPYLFVTLAALFGANALPNLSTRFNADPLVVDLGDAGVYKAGYAYNNTVKYWRGIPYAAAPVDDLRFRAPKSLAKQNDTIVDVSGDGYGQSCVQFSEDDPEGGDFGVEDCLRLWIFVPASAKEGDNLPVHIYYHGGGYQNGNSVRHDYSQWVGDDQNFIAVNANYRLGLLGFFGSVDASSDANVGLLDARFAADWVRENIGKFGGDGNQITISGQSGGGGLVKDTLVMYDGKKPNYQRAVPRSIQRSPQYTVERLIPRNDAFAATVNCTQSSSTAEGAKAQLDCLRKVSAEDIRIAAEAFPTGPVAPSDGYPGWLPSIDGKTLTDQSVRLFRQGKFAKVPVMPAAVTQEFASFSPNPPPFSPELIRQFASPNISGALVANLTRIYPEPITNASYNTGTYEDNIHRVWNLVDENLAKCSAPMIARAASKAGVPAYELRFDAPQPDFLPYQSTTHSSDNYYLEENTSNMNSTQAAIAYEWRAYHGSLIRHGDPNVEKLEKSPKWYKTETDWRYEPRMVISFALNSSAAPEYPTNSGMELVDAAEYDRCSYWLSAEVDDETNQ